MSELLNTRIDLSIIIVNYNLAHEVRNCLNSLFVKKKDVNYEVIIIDNNSPDKGLVEVEKEFKKENIHFYYLKENVGFGQGCNYGFSKATGEYICFLNPDTLITNAIFLTVINLFESDKSIGIIGPKQKTRNPFFDFSAGFYPNIFFEICNLFGIGVLVEAFIVFLYTKLKKESILKVDWILGGAIFISSDLFKMVNGFDKDYFMFFEEVDLCKRITNKGYKIIYCPELQIHHIGSVSGKKDYALFTRRIYSSKYIYVSKHYKSFYKFVMKLFLFSQIISQIIIWFILFPINNKKSKQKMSGLFYLVKFNMRIR